MKIKDTVLKRGKSTDVAEEAKIAKRKYHREWQRANKDKVMAYQNRYWEKKLKAAEVNSTEEVNV